jgi:hypothetical protein
LANVVFRIDFFCSRLLGHVSMSHTSRLDVSYVTSRCLMSSFDSTIDT